METFTCYECRETKPVLTDGGTGYGIDDQDRKICYACCGKRDAAAMDRDGRISLYWDDNGRIANWPGTLTFTAHTIRKHRHNWHHVGQVTIAYFRDAKGALWSGRHAGGNTQIMHCRRLKERSARHA